jgi:hypothetical protein
MILGDAIVERNIRQFQVIVNIDKGISPMITPVVLEEKERTTSGIERRAARKNLLKSWWRKVGHRASPIALSSRGYPSANRRFRKVAL